MKLWEIFVYYFSTIPEQNCTWRRNIMTFHYESVLSTRYGSEYMLQLFSMQNRIQTWRALWTELARAQYELGLPITLEQVKELEEHITDIDFKIANEREKEVHHDVMAHIYAYGVVAPAAAGIIHLGATSCYITDNADLIIYRDALQYLRKQLVVLINILADFVERYKAFPTIGYTHYQPAQLVTVGKRAALWLQDFCSDLDELDYVLSNCKFLGCRGATGTEASLLDLFKGDSRKVDELNQKISNAFGFSQCFDISSQTYPRKVDSRILNCLSSVSQSCYRMANDIRLLQHDQQLEECFSEKQIGSSAMPYKRNPILCERICSLSRYVMVNAQNASLNASTQWLERTLDDSANRRVVMPESFLCVDEILRQAQNVIQNLYVNEEIIEHTTKEYLQFVSTEKLLMEGVMRGGNRQQLHEIIRICSMEAYAQAKIGKEYNLLDQLAKNPDFPLSEADMQDLLKPEMHIGRSVDQVDAFLDKLRSNYQMKNK